MFEKAENDGVAFDEYGISAIGFKILLDRIEEAHAEIGSWIEMLVYQHIRDGSGSARGR